jgi:hypothetical protein
LIFDIFNFQQKYPWGFLHTVQNKNKKRFFDPVTVGHNFLGHALFHIMDFMGIKRHVEENHDKMHHSKITGHVHEKVGKGKQSQCYLKSLYRCISD